MAIVLQISLLPILGTLPVDFGGQRSSPNLISSVCAVFVLGVCHVRRQGQYISLARYLISMQIV